MSYSTAELGTPHPGGPRGGKETPHGRAVDGKHARYSATGDRVHETATDSYAGPAASWRASAAPRVRTAAVGGGIRERICQMKNRMREIRTSGSVRGEGGNPLAYSTSEEVSRKKVSRVKFAFEAGGACVEPSTVIRRPVPAAPARGGARYLACRDTADSLQSAVDIAVTRLPGCARSCFWRKERYGKRVQVHTRRCGPRAGGLPIQCSTRPALPAKGGDARRHELNRLLADCGERTNSY